MSKQPPPGQTKQDPNQYTEELQEGPVEETLAQAADGTTPEQQGTAGGFYAGIPPVFDQTDEEMVNFNCSPAWHGNSWIVFGRDRNAGRLSGCLGSNRSKSSMIDLVAGRMPWEDNAAEQVAAPNFKGDAARIYISQNANIDRYFELEVVKCGINPAKDMSAIGIKADAVRIIGRAGIKLVTRTEKKTSTMGDGDSIGAQGEAGIELIALNDNSNVQPMVLGSNLVDCLKDLRDLIYRTQTQLINNMDSQILFRRGFKAHTHGGPFPGPTSTPLIGQAAAAPKPVNRQKRNLKNIQKRLNNWEQKWLDNSQGDTFSFRGSRADGNLSCGPTGPLWGDYILSPHNKNN